MLTAGSVVAGYRIERVLGAGGMGTVYLAANPTLPRHDALKVLSTELSRDADFRARFVREADVASALDHPNIVSVYNRGQTEGGELWIAMQFVDGTNADAELRDGTMTPQRAVHIIAEVGKAIDYAHSRNVVHRDVKPANFLLSGPAGAGERVLLGDFGIARALDDVGLTVTGSVMATVAYAAPEVLASMPFDGRADLYSLGCTLFRLLTGKTPFSAANGMAAVMMAHLQAPPPRVTDQVPSLPAAFDAVIATAMAKDPAARFQSAAALAEAAQAALSDRSASSTARWQPVSSGEVSSYPRLTPEQPWWQHSGPRTAMRPPQLAQPPVGWPRPRRRRRAVIAAALAAVALLVAGLITWVAWPGGAPTSPVATGTAGGGGQAAAPGPSQAPPATDVPAEALRSILLTATQITAAIGGDPMVLEEDRGDLLDDAPTVDNPDCLGAWMPAEQQVYAKQPAYAGGGSTSVAVQALRAMNKKAWQEGVIQAVATFASTNPRLSSQSDANNFLRTQLRQWDACAGKTITVTPAGEPTQVWEFGHSATNAGAVTLDAALRGGGGFCQRGMMVAGNVIIDLRQCRSQGGNDASALVNATAGKVPRQ
jgi:serine/threonine-protein kinase